MDEIVVARPSRIARPNRVEDVRWTVWTADGREFREFEYENGQWVETPWWVVERLPIVRMRVEGLGHTIDYDPVNWAVSIDGKPLSIQLRDDVRVVRLICPPGASPDNPPLHVFQYKQAATDLVGGGAARDSVLAYVSGMKRDGIMFQARIEPGEASVPCSLWVDTGRGFDGVTEIGFAGRVHVIPTRLEPGRTAQLPLWVVR